MADAYPRADDLTVPLVIRVLNCKLMILTFKSINIDLERDRIPIPDMPTPKPEIPTEVVGKEVMQPDKFTAP